MKLRMVLLNCISISTQFFNKFLSAIMNSIVLIVTKQKVKSK